MKRMKRAIQADEEYYELTDKLEQIADAHGYILSYAEAYKNGKLGIGINKGDNDPFAPEVTYRPAGPSEDYNGFKINASASGSRTLDEFGELLDSFNNAYEMASEMSDAIDLIGVEPGVTIAEYRE